MYGSRLAGGSADCHGGGRICLRTSPGGVEGDKRMNPISCVAGAPISWGVNEVSGWGYQMNVERVLGEAASLGLPAIEAGPEGFLPGDPAAASRLLDQHGLRLVGGFVPAVL